MPSSRSAATETTAKGRGVTIDRRFTEEGVHPFDAVEWEIRDALIGDPAKPAFEQRGVEFPRTWSQNATNIVAQKYFRGRMGSDERESSVRQMVGRVAGTIAGWGRELGYFATTADGEAFEAELTHILLNQMAAFNSPVWFNVGFEPSPQASACFILSVDDTLESILDWNTKEGMIFRGGSGSGINLSRIRSSQEQLSKGGLASGPVSFMRGADAWAGTIKSGGKTRRAAKMVVLDVDHPDVLDFIWCKAREEEKAAALRDAGFDMRLDSESFASIQYQNANNSVRVTDEFMERAERGEEWELTARVDGRALRTLPAREVLDQIAEAAWRCADPGVQYDTTINDWHTCPNSGRINASNPCCFTGETLVHTADGLVRFDELYELAAVGEDLPDAVAYDDAEGRAIHTAIADAWVAGMTTRLVEIETDAGVTLRCTPEHRFLLADGGYVEAQHISCDMKLRTATPAQIHAGISGSTAAQLDPPASGMDTVAAARSIELADPVPVYDLEVPATRNFSVTGARAASQGVVVHNSEYMHVDDSACNLASINLLKFRRADGSFDVEAFEHTVDVMILAQEIVVGPSSYPTEEIGRNARDFRQLGLGYANLGALLMADGLPYDSDEGRAVCGAITALMTGRAYRKSAEVAAAMGPYARYEENDEPHLHVMRKHRDATAEISDALCRDDELLAAARRAWDEAVELGAQHGYRNAQATVLAPTGCLVSDSLVTTSRGVVRLRSLGDTTGEKWQPLDVQVATDEGPRQATRFYVNGMESVVSVETARGYRIQGTPTHRIKVVDESGDWVWRRMAEIQPGDRVPMMLGGLVGEPCEVPLPPLGDLHWNADRHTRVPRQMTPELAELVGYFMGDGSLHSKGLRLCVPEDDHEVSDRLVTLTSELFGLDAHLKPSEGYTELAIHSVPLALWWEACGFAKHQPRRGHSGKGWSPHIPDAVLHSNERGVYAAFIRGLFEADGNANHGYAYWNTTNEAFSRDVQSLLLALEFVTTRSLDTARDRLGAPCHRLRLLNASSASRFVEEIGFISERKNAALLTDDHPQAARHDHVPLSRATVDELAPENDSLRRNLLLQLARSGAVSRRSATALLERGSTVELERVLGYFFDVVDTTEPLDDQPTFDLSVPDNLTYVANGFVSHNTISFLMDCDTTGIEPDFSLVKFKELVGGGQMTIVNRTVPPALRTLGYSEAEIQQIEAHLAEEGTIIGAPGLHEEHLPVFDVAVGERAISHMGHIEMMAAAQPFISGAISKCVVGDTLVASERGLVRIGSLRNGERPDSFRDMRLTVASLDGVRDTDAFYYGGERIVRKVTLRSGHRVVGTDNHPLLVCGDDGLEWRRLDELEAGDYVALQYGDDLWAPAPASFGDFVPSPSYGSQKTMTRPTAMSEELAFFLGAYAAEGHVSRATHTVRIANADESVIERLVRVGDALFGFTPKVVRRREKCPSVEMSSKRLVEFLDYLGCGDRASNKRIPDAVLRSPRSMVLRFIDGLCLDAYLTTRPIAKWAICLDSDGMLDDLQAVLTNLGVVHSRITKHNAIVDKDFDEVYACGREAQRLVEMIELVEPHKAERAAEIRGRTFAQSASDVIPGVLGRDLHELVPAGQSGRAGAGTGHRTAFSHLLDPRTKYVSRESLVRLADVPGVELPSWAETVLERNLHFSPVASVSDAGEREVYDVSVPGTHAFVANGIVNHNTVNLPETATVDDVADAYLQGWRLRLKALAIYRDGSKTAQALRTDAKKDKAEPAEEPSEPRPVRRRMPRERQSITHKFSIAGHEGYITAGMYEDGSVGEIFLTDIGKEGSTLRGMMNAFATSVSIALQYGVPLETLVRKFSYMRFDPEGITGNPEIPFAKSMPDYIMRWLCSRFCDGDLQEELGILTPEVRARKAAQEALMRGDTAAPANGGNGHGEKAETRVAGGGRPRPAAEAITDEPPVLPAKLAGLDLGPACGQCGGMMQRTGSCYTCSSCGNNTGCG